MNAVAIIFTIISTIIVLVNCRQPCAHRDYGYGSTVCVCNQTYCDDLEPLVKTPKGVVTVYETSKSGHRFEKTELKFGHKLSFKANKSQTITIDKSKGFLQKIVGFGGAFTDAAGLNIKKLPEKLQNHLIDDYFGETGIEYTLGRIPIGGSDFSTHAYTYDDNNTNDFDFKYWKLAKEDIDYKLPYLKQALKSSMNKVRYFGSTWSPPAWLKNNSEINDGGYIIGEPGGKHYQAYAKYLVKFLDEYKAQGIDVWGLTIANEPLNANKPHFRFNCLGFTPELQRDFIKKDLGPILEKSGYGVNTTQLMIYDDNIKKLHDWAQVIYGDKEAAKYVTGSAFHWYQNQNVKEVSDILDKTRAVNTDKYLLSTEGCEEWRGQPKHVYLGSWQLFERYANDIMTDLNHWASGWVDWNLALNEQGGPNWVNNFVDAPIIVNTTGQEYYKQPFFYALGHYSKFLTPGSHRVYQTHDTNVDKIQTTSFVRTDGATVVIALNTGDQPLDLTIHDLQSNLKVSHVLSARSIQTYLYYN